MSVVAVRKYDDKIVIGADSIRVTGYTQEKDSLAKLVQVNGLIIGDVGKCEEGSLLWLFCQNRKPVSSDCYGVTEFFVEFRKWYGEKIGTAGIALDNTYILVFESKIFLIHSLYIREIHDYYAIGAGMDYALTALYLGQDVKKAIEAACELSIYCEQPINMLEISTKSGAIKEVPQEK